MKLTVVRDTDPDTWDDFVAAFPSSGPLHTAAWAECFRSERLTPIYLRLLFGHRPVGGFSLLGLHGPGGDARAGVASGTSMLAILDVLYWLDQTILFRPRICSDT